MMEAQGVYADAVTPRGKHGDVDFGAAFELIDFLCKGGVNGIALCSETGEWAALNPAERSRLVYLSLKRSRVPVLVGIASTTLEGSVGLAREARDAGAAGLLLPVPHSAEYDQDDLREFYLRFAREWGGGPAVYLSRLRGAAARLETATVLELLSTGQFAGVVEGGGAQAVADLKEASGDGAWRILAAEDGSFAPARCAGAHGGISAAACAMPELMAALERSITAHQRQRSADLDERLRQFTAWAEQFPRPVAVRAAAGVRRIETGPPALPLGLKKQKSLAAFEEWFRGWLPETLRLAAG